MKNLIYRYGIYLIVTILSLPVLLALLHNGFFSMHDDTQVQRVFEMAKALNNGMFPVRWSMDLGYGYGYPMFNYYAPFIYYLGAVISFIGFSFIVSTKIMITVGIILSGMGMFLLARKLFGTLAGLSAAILYVYAPYHALDVYVRGDLAEAFAFGFIPLLFYFLLQVADSRKFWKWIFPGAITFALLIITHNLTALMVLPLLVVASAFLLFKTIRSGDKYRSASIMVILIAGILLAGFYWLPAISEMSYTNVMSVTKGGSDFHQHFVCLPQLWNSPWGFGGSAPGCIDGISFRIGKAQVIASITALLLTLILLILPKYSRKVKEKLIPIIGIFVGLSISIFMTLQNSVFIWNAFSFMSFFQFPWRFLLLIAFFSSLAGGVLIWSIGIAFSRFALNKYLVIISSFVIIAATIFFNAKLFVPQTYIPVTDSLYTSNAYLIWNTSKVSDEYMPKDSYKPQTKNSATMYHLVSGNGLFLVKNVTHRTNDIEFTVLSSKAQSIIVHSAPFPAWRVYVNGHQSVPKIAANGYIISISKGSQQVELAYISTTIEKVANWLSLTGLALLIIAIILIRSKEKNANTTKKAKS